MNKRKVESKPRKKPDLSEYQIFKDGKFNLKKPPKGYNYLYGKCIVDTKINTGYEPTINVGRLAEDD